MEIRDAFSRSGNDFATAALMVAAVSKDSEEFASVDLTLTKIAATAVATEMARYPVRLLWDWASRSGSFRMAGLNRCQARADVTPSSIAAEQARRRSQDYPVVCAARFMGI
jgi:hypothetical protein